MTIQEAVNFFENLSTETTKKSEIKVYEKFLHILNKLKNKDFSKDDIHAIERELDRLNLASNPKHRKNYFKKTLGKFEKFLMDSFSLISKDHYTKIYGGLGMTAGLLFGLVFLSNSEQSLGMSLGLIIGMVIGSIIGQSMDAKAKREGSVL